MPPGGYAWWYVDGVSDDGRHGLTVIAFLGSVFSPYYAWSGRQDPLDHSAVNVVLYGAPARWAMTERRRRSVARDAASLSIGPSSLAWDGSALTIRVSEVTAPLPSRLSGTIRVYPRGITPGPFTLDAEGRHRWWPIAPASRIEVDLDRPALRWRGHAYFDTNDGDTPLEASFRSWTWSRATLRHGAAILYDVLRRDGTRQDLSLRFDPDGTPRPIEPPIPAALPPTLWRLKRATRSDDGQARVLRRFEDAPFYSRSQLAARICGEAVEPVHEALCLDRFRHPLVRLMLPFRMPRALG
ncbi:hydroxyneurosporene synthase [Methylobacterium sp. 4-46]|uniref:carotenoid 1,2-hydratase n=1 Tax=unclassified Methylobacterium TaxID=2615210 RepID=UPI000165C7AE|nr:MULTISPECIES: carotenoid 1,2-hydratase [Methylobacterium]ACA18073.1 hydroxyneurosporene synthase [Methylobacterium sp. 4-46]WFT77373.1 carotenoid 1,2-hydratase [Methylobacterium nodulans]